MKTLLYMLFFLFLFFQTDLFGQEKESGKTNLAEIERSNQEIGTADIDNDGLIDTVRFDSIGQNMVFLLSTNAFQPVQYTYNEIPDNETQDIDREMGYVFDYYLENGMLCVTWSSPKYKYEFFEKYIYDNKVKKLRAAYGQYIYNGPFYYDDEEIDLLKGKRISSQSSYRNTQGCIIESVVEKIISKDVIYFDDVGNVMSLIDNDHIRDEINELKTVTTICYFGDNDQLSKTQTYDSVRVCLKKGLEAKGIMIFQDRNNSKIIDPLENWYEDNSRHFLGYNDYVVFIIETDSCLRRCYLLDKGSGKNLFNGKEYLLLSCDTNHEMLLYGDRKNNRYMTLLDLGNRTRTKIAINQFVKDKNKLSYHYTDFTISDVDGNSLTLTYENDSVGPVSFKIRRLKPGRVKDSHFMNVKCEFVK